MLGEPWLNKFCIKRATGAGSRISYRDKDQ